MWFLGFLFCYSLLALPLFVWLKGEAGRRAVSRLARLCERRGAILLFILPIAAVRLGLHPFFPRPARTGPISSPSGRFSSWAICCSPTSGSSAPSAETGRSSSASGSRPSLAGTVIGISQSFEVEKAPSTFWDFLVWGIVATCGWCWTGFMLYIGMRHLDFDSKTLRYGQATLLPFFVLHQPAILAVAYFVVQWQAPIALKLLLVVFGAFLLAIGLVELVIKRVGVLRTLFGMKAG